MPGNPLPFAQPDITQAEVVAVTEVLRSGWLTSGPRVAELEAAFARASGFPYAVAVNSGTAALHLALSVTGLQEGDEVILSPYTCASSAAAVRFFGARPVFCDIEADSLHLNPQLLLQHLGPKTRVIVVSHVAGNRANTQAICTFARRHGLKVIEDASALMPSQVVDSPSDLVCFSFYATKALTSAEGGMVCTRHPDWAAHCRQMAHQGLSRDTWKRQGQAGSWFYQVEAAGYAYHLTDVAAALGLVQLQRSQEMHQRRQEIAQTYQQVFSQVPELQVPQSTPDHSWHLYTLRLNLPVLAVGRSSFAEELRERGIGTGVHFIPLHLHPYYQQTYGYQPEDCLVAHREYLRELSLPIYSRMTQRDVRAVIRAVLETVRAHPRKANTFALRPNPRPGHQSTSSTIALRITR